MNAGTHYVVQENQGKLLYRYTRVSEKNHTEIHAVSIRCAYFYIIIPTVKFGTYVSPMQQIFNFTVGTIST